MSRRNILVVCLALSVLAGCGKKPPPVTTSAPTNLDVPSTRRDDMGGPISLTFWHIFNYSGPQEIMEDAVKRFQRSPVGVTVVTQAFENDAYKQKLAVESASGKLPDVFFTWGGSTLSALAQARRVRNLTRDINRREWRGRLNRRYIEFCADNGQVFAVPLDVSCVPVWYNADVFAKYDLSPPKTFPELMTLCKTLRQNGVTPFALGNQQSWPGAFFYIYLVQRLGGTAFFQDVLNRKAGIYYNNAIFIKAGEMLQQMVDAECFSTGCNGLDEATARSRFLDGEAAMYLMGTWLVPHAKEAGFLKKLKCFPFPAIPGGRGDPSVIVGGVNGAFAVSSTCEHPDKAVELISVLTDPETCKAWCEIGRIPALVVDKDSLDALPGPSRDAMKMLEAAADIQPYYDQSLPPRMQEAHKTSTKALFAKEMTPKRAADYMENVARGNE